MKKLFIPFFLFVIVILMNAQTAGTLNVKFTTIAGGGSYSPKNLDACWVVNSSGVFVKTLIASTSGDKNDLTNWKTATSTYDKVDAVTAATRTSYGLRTGTWDGTNNATPRVQQADGVYTVKMEMTDRNGTGNVATFTFTKGPTAQTVSPANISVFTNISLEWVPVKTAVEEVKLSKLYTAYPNPTNSFIFVNGIDIKEIEICTVAGKSIFITNEQKVDLSSFPKGIYLAVVKTKLGTVVKKIEKL